MVVVEAFNEREDLGAKFLLVRPRAPVDQLLFVRRKEGLGDRVVVGRSDLWATAVGPGKLVKMRVKRPRFSAALMRVAALG